MEKQKIVTKWLRFCNGLCYNGGMKRHMKAKIGVKILCGGVLILVGAVLLGVVRGADDEASALTYTDSVNVQFTLNPTISISLSTANLTISNLAPGSSANSNTVTATVTTNNSSGFYIKAATGNAKITNSSNSSYYFDSLASAVTSLANIPEGRWGYSYSTDSGSSWSNYAALPVGEGNAATLLTQSSFASSGSVQLRIGAKATSAQPFGTYTGTVNFYAVAK